MVRGHQPLVETNIMLSGFPLPHCDDRTLLLACFARCVVCVSILRSSIQFELNRCPTVLIPCTIPFDHTFPSASYSVPPPFLAFCSLCIPSLSLETPLSPEGSCLPHNGEYQSEGSLSLWLQHAERKINLAIKSVSRRENAEPETSLVPHEDSRWAPQSFDCHDGRIRRNILVLVSPCLRS
jgi:hypothetical protein